MASSANDSSEVSRWDKANHNKTHGCASVDVMKVEQKVLAMDASFEQRLRTMTELISQKTKLEVQRSKDEVQKELLLTQQDLLKTQRELLATTNTLENTNKRLNIVIADVEQLRQQRVEDLEQLAELKQTIASVELERSSTPSLDLETRQDQWPPLALANGPPPSAPQPVKFEPPAVPPATSASSQSVPPGLTQTTPANFAAPSSSTDSMAIVPVVCRHCQKNWPCNLREPEVSQYREYWDHRLSSDNDSLCQAFGDSMHSVWLFGHGKAQSKAEYDRMDKNLRRVCVGVSRANWLVLCWKKKQWIMIGCRHCEGLAEFEIPPQPPISDQAGVDARSRFFLDWMRQWFPF